VQVVVEALLHPGHFIPQVLVMGFELGDGEREFVADRPRRDAGEEQAVDVFDHVVAADFAHSGLLEKLVYHCQVAEEAGSQKKVSSVQQSAKEKGKIVS
jgi:hypothetical protein